MDLRLNLVISVYISIYLADSCKEAFFRFHFTYSARLGTCLNMKVSGLYTAYIMLKLQNRNISTQWIRNKLENEGVQARNIIKYNVPMETPGKFW